MGFGCPYVNQIGQNCGQPAGHMFKHGNGLITRPTDTWHLPADASGQEIPAASVPTLMGEIVPTLVGPSEIPLTKSERTRIYIDNVIDSAIENLMRTKSVLRDLV
jgi:hypothetical protein